MIVINFLGTVSGIPSKERNHPAIALEYHYYKKETLLFDCGECVQKQLMLAKISFMDIEKIFITHWHADHFAGLIPLLQTMNLEKRKKELKIFGPEASKFVNNIINLGYFGLRFPVKAIDVPFEGNKISKIDESKEYEIFSVPVLHTVPSVAYCFKEKDRWRIDKEKLEALKIKSGRWLKKLKECGKIEIKGKNIKIEDIGRLESGLKVVYTGDTKPCDNVVELAKNADVLIHDATFSEEDEDEQKYHSSVRDAAIIAKKAEVKKLILTHISRRYQSEDVKKLEEEAKKYFENSMVAKDMMKIVLKRTNSPRTLQPG
ncbi:MAG: ribonuclease Z [Candidatus Aenigmarchaeota archaeon]|nr:ribonuclease Z [Candidatus Aenigmarchaeota archaeon]MDW8160364.1 ribonuclease Z [Candidatus Aenigmarchaeota archaeon]